MKLHHYAFASVVALGLLGGCGSFYGSVGVVDEPAGYYALNVYDGPDYEFYRDGHYYYGHSHRDDGWRRTHEREQIRLDRSTRERYVREQRESRAQQAGHREREEHRDGRD